MKKLIPIILAALVLPLFGCAETAQVFSLPGVAEKAVDKIPVDVGRFSAHVAVRTVEEQTKQKVVDLEKAELELQKAQAENTTIIVDTNEKAFSLAMVEMARTMREAFRSLAKRDGVTEYGLATTPTPKGVIAESIDSAGDSVGKVANTPAALGTAIGVTIGRVASAGIRNAGDTASEGSTITKTTTVNQVSGQESVVNNGGGEKASGTCSIASAHLSDCRTTTNGPAAPDEYNACLIKDYGYSSDAIASCPQ